MPYTHARRRGATVQFRRKIPMDLRDRFGSQEIVRSIGRASPGEARRIVHRLWLQTEIVFMRVRAEHGLSREKIARVVAAAVEEFQDEIDYKIADVVPGAALEGLNEPVDQAARLRGQAALYDIMLNRNDVADRTGAVRDLATAVLGKSVERDSVEERRLCRAVTKGVQAEMLPAAQEFDRLASHRPASSAVHVLSGLEYEACPELMEAARQAKRGENFSSLIAGL